jgi:hypothetical protein
MDSSPKHQLCRALISVIAIMSPNGAVRAEENVDVIAYFSRLGDSNKNGWARKTKLVDVRPAVPGEIIVTTIKGQGKETQSAPAKDGDMVVRNRCPETGNEEILVSAEVFVRRYEGATSKKAQGGWTPYRPRGVRMRFVRVPASEKEFAFTAPWGEKMIAKPGDVIVQDPTDSRDTYRVAKAAFACTYQVLRAPTR